MTKLHNGLKDCEFCKERKVKCYEVLMGRMVANPLTDEMQQNLEGLLIAANLFRAKYGKPLRISSGYRPLANNTTAGGAKRSAHLVCMAVDFADQDKAIKEFISKNTNILEECDLYMESPEKTASWCHLQTRKTISGKRIFQP